MSGSLYILPTSDGSKTIFNAAIGESYHSKHGALQESKHVFVDGGLKHYHQLYPDKTTFSVLEIGFGTGLNFLLSNEFALEANIPLYYQGIEAYPLDVQLLQQTGYQYLLKIPDTWEDFLQNYTRYFEEEVQINPSTKLRISPVKVLDFKKAQSFDIIYFDAFAAIHQPEMWTREVLQHVCSFLKDKGIFVTYSVTGNLKRILSSLGFSIERPKGAAGKREMMRATKHESKNVQTLS